MHYYIDGYNLLFRYSCSDHSFQKEREALILELESKVRLLRLDVTLVFDSYYHREEGSLSHFNALRICFTDQGETADDFIVNAIKKTFRPNQHTVVTSDRLLGDRCRSLSALVETVEEFLGWFNSRYQNRRRQLKLKTEIRRTLSPSKNVSIKEESTTSGLDPTPENPLQNPSASVEECFQAYLEIFVNKVAEEGKSKSLVKGKGKKTTKAAKKLKKEPQDLLESDIDRWMRLFHG